MDQLTRYVKEAFEPKLGRPMPDEEAADFAMHLRRFAAFLMDCSKDKALMERLGLAKRPAAPRAGPRVPNSTTQNGGKPLGTHPPASTDAPTGAPSHAVSSHRVSSASRTDTSPSEPLPTPTALISAATVNGS